MLNNVNDTRQLTKCIKRIAYKCNYLLHFILAHIASIRSSYNRPNNHPRGEDKIYKNSIAVSQKESALSPRKLRFPQTSGIT